MDIQQKQAKDANLLQLKQKVTIRAARSGLISRKFKVALSIDVSGSMVDYFRSGRVQEIVERMLALAMQFDDDGEIDIFAFGTGATYCGTVNKNNYHECVQYHGGYDVSINGKRLSLTGTNYAPAFDLVLKHYFGDSWRSLNTGGSSGFLGFGKKAGSGRPHLTSPQGDPVFHLFVTDGECSDYNASLKIVDECSQLPMFTQFAGFGSGFRTLDAIDNMSGRYVDNAGVFTASSLGISDDELYDGMLNELPQWVRATSSEGWY
jgi:hypothetical protein